MQYDELVRFANWMRDHASGDALDCRGDNESVMLEAWITPAHVAAFNRQAAERNGKAEL